MIRTILVPFDGSEGSRAALAAARVSAGDARTVALHVVAPVTGTADAGDSPDEQYRRAFEDARERLAEAREVALEHGDEERFDAEFVYGHPLHEILRYVDRYVVDRVVIGSHGRDGTGGSLGSLAETVVDRAPVPVTVVRSAPSGDSRDDAGSVLVPFDGSPPARDALAYAIDRFPRAAITATYADYPTTADLDRLGPRGDAATGFDDWHEEVRAWHEAADRDPDAVLDIASEVAGTEDREIRTAVETGDPARVLVDRAAREGADHVVVGSHGREGDGLTGHLLGSVARFVVRRSPMSVTVVR